MSGFSQIVVGLLLIWVIALLRLPRWLWPFLIALLLYSFGLLRWIRLSAWFLWPLLLIIAIPLNVPPIRRRLSNKIFTWFRKKLPLMSETERQAIEAGDVWWEKDLLQGNPHWRKFLKAPKPTLSNQEQAFLDNQVETLCQMLDDWKIVHEESNLTPEIWTYIKKEKFFAMIIPKAFGGLEFSPLAHSAIITKIATRSVSAAVTIMVPNSLGPAELIMNYGTQKQQQYYLPKLAIGEEIPCFALTSPEAGSDAGAIEDKGVVCKGLYEGEEVIGILLSFDKRYITLAPVATVFGLAFKLYDPDHLLSPNIDVGITLCLIPAKHPGVEIGKRHFPLNMAFMNGPIRGKDVFVPVDWIVGGAKMAGQGWRMLMECLSAGRGISLPALSCAIGVLAYRMTSAYAAIRRQFNVSIGSFEGVEQGLSKIAGYTYLLQAARTLTADGINQGIKPSVATAIAKYHMTEISRKVMNEAMDIHAGKGIMLGPSNYLARGYQALPISITVEGANILTRNLIIFGQGAIRCHPFAKKEFETAQDYVVDPKKALKAFDKLIASHIGYFIHNTVKCFTFAISRGIFSITFFKNRNKHYIKKINWLSAALAFTTDIAFMTLGGELKRKENLSARLGDVLSQLYLASALIKYYQDEDNQSDEPYVIWGLQMCLFEAQEAFYGFFNNFTNSKMGMLLKWFIFPYGRIFSLPKDKVNVKCAKVMLNDVDVKSRLTNLCYIGKTIHDPTGLMETTFNKLIKTKPIMVKIYQAEKQQKINKNLAFEEKIQAALAREIINKEESQMLLDYEAFRKKAIAVDEFNSSYALGVQHNET